LARRPGQRSWIDVPLVFSRQQFHCLTGIGEPDLRALAARGNDPKGGSFAVPFVKEWLLVMLALIFVLPRTLLAVFVLLRTPPEHAPEILRALATLFRSRRASTCDCKRVE